MFTLLKWEDLFYTTMGKDARRSDKAIGWKLLILPSPSKASKKSIMDKIGSLKLLTRTGSIYVLANLLNSLVKGGQNYYCYFINGDLNDLWHFVNRRLEKWCKWNKRMNLRKSRR